MMFVLMKILQTEYAGAKDRVAVICCISWGYLIEVEIQILAR